MSGKGYSPMWVTDQLGVGSAPMSYPALQALKEEGVVAILNLCAEFCDLHWIESEAGFEVYYLPIPDEEAPDLEEMEKALDWLDEQIYLGKKALIHCRHGIGRTGTILNAYLLRKGLGHKLASRKLSGFRSKPANFNQWWFIRKYGKREKKLTIREPSLETRHLVDLFPYFRDLETLLEDVDATLARSGAEKTCGMGHAKCCKDLVALPLVEAVYVNHSVTATLARTTREMVTSKGVDASRVLREVRREVGEEGLGPGVAEAYRRRNQLCPLSEYGDCLIYDHRPLACRVFDLGEGHEALLGRVREGLAELSNQLFFAFTSDFAGRADLQFALQDVVTGKFVQVFFRQLMLAEESRPGKS